MNVDQIEQLLTQLQSTLDELTEVQEAKERALASMDAAELERLSEREGELAAQLKEASRRRQQFVATASPHAPTRSFRDLLASDPKQQELLSKFDRVRERARQVKRIAASNWFATYRTHQHVQNVVQIVAQAGQASEKRDDGHQGLFLDSTA